MKTFPFFILLLTLASSAITAAEIKIDDAKRVAVHFYYEKHMRHAGPVDLNVVAIREVHVEHAGGVPVYYVFHMSPAGFVIVPAEDVLVPVIGYSLDGHFEAENQPPNVQWWFRQYKDQVVYARENALQPGLQTAEKWDHYLDEDFRYLPLKSAGREVVPLMTTLWNQVWPYNYYCPQIPTGGSGGRAVAGCHSTALAQILYYWRWPDHGQGYTEYIPAFNPQYGLQIADYENTFYLYDEMVDAPQSLNTANAELTYHCAVNFHTNFTPGLSFVDSIFILDNQLALDSTSFHFKLLPAVFHYRDSMPEENWKSLMFSMLDASAPIFYAGYDDYPLTGHFFVCDGYQDEEYFHFNMGWSGSDNGYYTIDNILDFNSNQFMSSILVPDTLQFSYPSYASGSDTLVYIVGSITDGSGPIHNYLNNTHASWLIDPQNEMDSVINITLTFKRFDLYDDDDRLLIYDGEDSTATLLAELSGDSLPEPVTSTGNKVFIEFITGDTNTADGFYLNYKSTLPVWCNGMTQITAGAATFDDGSGDFFYYNGTSCAWSINPGLGEPLTIGFNYFDTEQDHDFLKIYDLGSQSLLATYSGYYETPPDPVTAPSGKMMLAFSTNSSVRGQGWEVTYPFTAIGENDEPLSFSFFPNPTTGALNVSFALPGETTCQLDIFDLTGRRVMALEEKRMAAGKHSGVYDLSSLEKGVYLLRMKAGDRMVVKKIVIS